MTDPDVFDNHLLAKKKEYTLYFEFNWHWKQIDIEYAKSCDWDVTCKKSFSFDEFSKVNIDQLFDAIDLLLKDSEFRGKGLLTRYMEYIVHIKEFSSLELLTEIRRRYVLADEQNSKEYHYIVDNLQNLQKTGKLVDYWNKN